MQKLGEFVPYWYFKAEKLIKFSVMSRETGDSFIELKYYSSLSFDQSASIHRQFFILFSWTWFPCLISRNNFFFCRMTSLLDFFLKIYECTPRTVIHFFSFSAVTAWWLLFSSSWAPRTQFVGVSYDLGKWGALSAEHQDSFLKGPVLLLPTIFFSSSALNVEWRAWLGIPWLTDEV